MTDNTRKRSAIILAAEDYLAGKGSQHDCARRHGVSQRAMWEMLQGRRQWMDQVESERAKRQQERHQREAFHRQLDRPEPSLPRVLWLERPDP
jgi:hypothetical protein